MQDIVWICTHCSIHQTEVWFDWSKLFKEYVDDIICTISGDPDN